MEWVLSIGKRTISIIMVVLLLEMFVISEGEIFASYYVFPGRYINGHITYKAVSGSNSYYANIARNCWNGKSSNVSISYYSGSDPNDADLRTNFNKLDSPTAGQLGITFLFYQGVVVDAYSNWDQATCVQYKDSSYENENQKLKTCVHEIGHALSMAHPQESLIDSVMRQGLRNSYVLTTYDKACLIYKWGGSVC